MDDSIAFNAACARNNVPLIEGLIRRGVSVNKYVDSTSQILSDSTPLNVAIKHQNLEVIDLLLKNGASIEAQNRMGQTSLHYAYYMTEISYPREKSWEIVDMILPKLTSTKKNVIDHNGLSHFHIACTRDQSDVIHHFLRCQVDINSQANLESNSFSGYTPLHFAVENNRQTLMKILLDNGADATIKNGTGITPLHLAFNVFLSNKELVDLISSKSLPNTVNPTNNFGLSHFHIVCATGNVNLIQGFLENQVSINAAVNFDSPKCPGYTPLHFAVEFNKKEAVEILLQHNASTDAKEKRGFTPLHLACQQDAKKIYAMLRNCVDDSDPHEDINFNCAFKESKCLNLLANQTEQVDIVDLLLQYRSDVNCEDNQGKTPLFHACNIDQGTFECKFADHVTQVLHDVMNEFYNKREKIIEVLLKYKSNTNVHDINGKTVLHYISDTDEKFVDFKKAEIAALILEHGANVNAISKTGSTPLHIALKRGHTDLIGVFLKYDIDPNIKNKNLCTPLHLATSNDLLAPKTEEIIQALLAKGADVDAKQIDGTTPLHIAASTRYSTSRLTTLLKVDCDIDCQDDKGKTPLHMACLNRNADNVENLLKCGADINITDNYGKTAFFYFYEFQIDVLDSRRNIYSFHQIYYIFKDHIRRLREIGFYVCWDNISYFMRLKELHKQQGTTSRDEEILSKCEVEIKRMKDIRIHSYASLYDIIFKDLNEMTLYVRNERFMEILNSNNFKNDFSQYGFLLETQWKKGLARCELLEPAKESFKIITGFSLPDSCSERIFRYTSNKSLRDLIKARETT